MNNLEREQQWASWMRLAIAGDSAAYRNLLTAITPQLRVMARRRCEQYGASSEAEDVVQEVLLAIHLKRGTWDSSRPLGPWMATLVRNKLIDSLRRRGRHVMVPLDDVIATLESNEVSNVIDRLDANHILLRLKEPQRTIVKSVSIEGSSIRETAERLRMTEVAVRVALHRALKALAALYAEQVK